MTSKKKSAVQQVLEQAARKNAEQRKAHHEEMFAKYGVVGNPKAAAAYSLAWQYGHSSGLHEVEIYFADLVDLIK